MLLVPRVMCLYIIAIAILLGGVTTTLAAFVNTPTSVNATLGSTAIFNCSVTTGVVDWIVNGSHLTALRAPDITSEQVGLAFSLQVPATEKYNNTAVVCELIIRDPILSFEVSNPAVLRVQGLLAVVGSLTVHSRRSSILLTWDPPFSLDITGVDPDLCYCVEVYNIRRGRALLATNCNVYVTQFYFNATNPSQCDVLEVRVFAVNQVGNGALTSVSGTFHASTFDANTAVAKYHSFGVVNVIRTFANNSQALGCLVVLHPWNTTQTEIFAYGARDCISAPTANVTIHGVPRGNYTVLVFDGEYNGLLSERAAIAPQNITVTDGGLEPVIDPEVHANINTSTGRVCVKCPDNGMSRGCVVVLRSPQDLLSAISLKIRRSDRERCFPLQKSGDYTVAVFKQRINKTLQPTPLIVFVVSISPNTSTPQTVVPEVADGDYMICAVDCIAGIIVAIIVTVAGLVTAVVIIVVCWKNERVGIKKHCLESQKPPVVHYADLETVQRKVRAPSEDDKVQYSNVLPWNISQQKTTSVLSEEPTPPPLLTKEKESFASCDPDVEDATEEEAGSELSGGVSRNLANVDDQLQLSSEVSQHPQQFNMNLNLDYAGESPHYDEANGEANISPKLIDGSVSCTTEDTDSKTFVNGSVVYTKQCDSSWRHVPSTYLTRSHISGMPSAESNRNCLTDENLMLQNNVHDVPVEDAIEGNVLPADKAVGSKSADESQGSSLCNVPPKLAKREQPHSSTKREDTVSIEDDIIPSETVSTFPAEGSFTQTDHSEEFSGSDKKFTEGPLVPCTKTTTNTKETKSVVIGTAKTIANTKNMKAIVV